MKNIFTKIASTAATSAGLSVAIAIGANNPAQAITFNFSWEGDAGYSASGQFSYDETTAPAIISESGLGPTNFLESISLSVFDTSSNLIESGISVINGVSNNPFLLFEFNTLTETLTLLDISTASAGNEPYYYISNTYDPSGNLVAPGSTTFNLNTITVSTNTTTSFGSAPSIQVQVAATPEPASVLGLLAFGALGAGSAFKKKQA